MTHARPNDVHIAVRITLPDEEPSKVANKSMDIKKKIEDMLKKRKLNTLKSSWKAFKRVGDLCPILQA